MSQIAWVELFVEEPSMEHALRALVPKIRPDLSERFQVHAFDGVDDMLQELPDRLRGYAGWLPADWRIVVIRDEDRKQCIALKAEVEGIARRAGLMPKSRSGRGRFHVLTRIAIEELEAWLLGDVPALAATYPRVPSSLGSQRLFRDVDAVRGGTWEALERVLQKAGHFLGGLPKVQVARETARSHGSGSKCLEELSSFPRWLAGPLISPACAVLAWLRAPSRCGRKHGNRPSW